MIRLARPARLAPSFARVARGVLAAALVALPLAGAGGCHSTQQREVALDIAPTTGLLAVDVENFAGSVELRVTGKGDTARVIADGHVDSFTTEPRHGDVAAGINVTTELIEEGARAVLKVRSTSAFEGSDHRVHLFISVPRCDGVRIVNAGGTVLVVGASGATEISNRFGAVELRTNQEMTDPVTITNVDGNIYYQVPTTSSGRFDLATLDGKVVYRDKVVGSDQQYAAPGMHQARLNNGENPVVARTNKGDVLVWVDKDPVALTRIIKKSFPDPRDMLFTSGSRRYTRNLPEDHPEVTGVRENRGYMFYDRAYKVPKAK